MNRVLQPRLTPTRKRRLDPLAIVALVLAIIGAAFVIVGIVRSGTNAVVLIAPLALGCWAALSLRRR